METKVLIGKYKSEDVLYNSSSGGAFTVLYEYAINHGYIVYGVKFDEHFKVVHSRATTIEECKEFRKSKYVLSDLKDIHGKVETDLREGKSVLFSGTPCQCSGLLNYLSLKRIDTTNLLIVDIICHGAPNQQIFDQYRLENQKREGDDWFRFRFKGKYANNGEVNSRSAEITYKSGDFQYRTSKEDPFLKGYYSRLFYRKSCAECPFANPSRVGDITIGDAWHIEDVKPDWNSMTGISLVLINTNKGLKLMPEIEKKMELLDSDIEWAVKNNAQLSKPTEMHKNRENFFKLLPQIGFYASVEETLSSPIWYKITRNINRVLKRSKRQMLCVFRRNN